MINKINLGFGNERSFLKKEKIIKIYNKGNIITSRPKSVEGNYQILSIKRYESPQNKIKKVNSNKNKSNKKKKKIERIESEEDKIKNVGFILRKSFTDEEWENIVEFGPNSAKNRIKLNKKKEEEVPKKIKPYIPNIEYNEESKEINERYLQRTINIFKENEYIINKVNEMLKHSKIINEDKIKKEKEKKLKRINNEKNNIRKFIDNKRKEIKKKDIKNEFFVELEDLNADNIKNLEKKDKENNNDRAENKKENKEIIKRIDKKKGFTEIIDINKDIKYIEAEKWLKVSKDDCEKMKDIITEIDQKIKNDKVIIKSQDIAINKNDKIEDVDKAKQIISEIKNNIDINHFNIKKLSKEDQKLLKGGKRYNSNNRKRNLRNKPIDKNKEHILMNSINSIKEIKEANKNMNEEIKKKNKLDKIENKVSKEWKINNECAKAYLNNFNKGKKVNINKIKEQKNIELENKKEIYNYIYMPKEYEHHWYNNKDTKDKTEYRHPFLIYDD